MRTAKYVWSLIVILCLCSMVRAQNINPSYEDGGLYIKLKENSSFKVKSGESRIISSRAFDFLSSNVKEFGIQKSVMSMDFAENPILSKTISITIDSVEKIDELIELLNQNPQIEYIEKRPIYYTCAINTTQPKSEHAYNDPLYGSVSGINHGWPLDLLQADSAWSIATGKPNIKVAVVDNAIWGGHEDLQIDSANLYNVTTQEVGSASPPASVNQNENCPAVAGCTVLDWSHGTHCAGNAGAITNNGIGMASLGGGVTLMGVGCPASSPNSVRNGFEGFRWAVENGAKVVSLSWGGNGTPSKTEIELVKTSYENGVVIVAAAGNMLSDNPFYPGALPYTICVGSVNSNKKWSSEFSNFGSWVDILAPGGFLMASSSSSTPTNFSILSTTFSTNQNYRLNGYSALDGQHYDGICGTSMATPIVAGLCGLILSFDSTLSPHSVKELLASTAEVIPENASRVRKGSGVANAFAALKALKGKLPMPYDFNCTLSLPDVSFTWKAPKTEGTNLTVSYYRIYKNGVLVKDNHTDLSFSEKALPSGNYSYSVEAIFNNEKVSLKDGIDILVPDYHSVVTNISPRPECGVVSGAGLFEAGKSITLVATPNSGFQFMRWKDGDLIASRDSLYTFKLEFDIVLTAVFKELASNELSSQANKLKFYPNPTRDLLYVEDLPAGSYLLQICDMQSRILKTMTVKGGNQIEVSVSELPKGQYIIRIQDKTTSGKKHKAVSTAKFNKI